jgi:hypothetical protein
MRRTPHGVRTVLAEAIDGSAFARLQVLLLRYEMILDAMSGERHDGSQRTKCPTSFGGADAARAAAA